MKTVLVLFITLCCSLSIWAQEKSLKDLVAKGNKVYVEFVDVKKNIPEAEKAIEQALLGEEWNLWSLVNTKNEADFTLKVSVEKKGMNILSMTSDGARVRVIAEVQNLENKTLWKSKRYQGNASMFTGFSAIDDAMRKLIRRALNDELMSKCNEL